MGAGTMGGGCTVTFMGGLCIIGFDPTCALFIPFSIEDFRFGTTFADDTAFVCFEVFDFRKNRMVGHRITQIFSGPLQ